MTSLTSSQLIGFQEKVCQIQGRDFRRDLGQTERNSSAKQRQKSPV